MNWWGLFLNICIGFAVACLILLFYGGDGYGLIALMFGVCIVAEIINIYNTFYSPPPIKEDGESEFTGDDFINCKVGEWLVK